MDTHSFNSRHPLKIKAEMIYLAWEATILYMFLMRIKRVYPGRDQCIVIENRSYGTIALSPIRAVVESEFTLWTKYKRSSDLHTSSTKYDPNLFTLKELKLLRQAEIIVVVDGSYSLDADKQLSLGRLADQPKYPDAHHWYVNFLCDSASSLKKSYFYQWNEEFRPTTSHGFFPYYWSGNGICLGVNVNGNYQKTISDICFSTESLHSSNGKPLVLTQTGLLDCEMHQKIKKLADYIPHSPCFFDFPPKESNPFLDPQTSESYMKEVGVLFRDYCLPLVSSMNQRS